MPTKQFRWRQGNGWCVRHDVPITVELSELVFCVCLSQYFVLYVNER